MWKLVDSLPFFTNLEGNSLTALPWKNNETGANNISLLSIGGYTDDDIRIGMFLAQLEKKTKDCGEEVIVPSRGDWVDVATPVELFIESHTATYVPSLSCVIIFGGMDENYCKKNSVHKVGWSGNGVVDVTANVVCTGDIPTARYRHSGSEYEGKVYIFGGDTDNGNLDDLCCYDVRSCCWTVIHSVLSKPGPRFLCTLTSTPEGIIWLIGGVTCSLDCTHIPCTDDVWSYDIQRSKWRSHTSKLVMHRNGHISGLNANGEIFVVGGKGSWHESDGSDDIVLLKTELNNLVHEKELSAKEAGGDPPGWLYVGATTQWERTTFVFGGNKRHPSSNHPTALLHYLTWK